MPMAGCHKSRGKYIITGVVTVTDYFERNIASDKNPTGTKFQYIPKDEFYDDYISPPYSGEMLQ